MNGREKTDPPTRCGCFEDYWYGEFGQLVGHGMLMRNRQSAAWPQRTDEALMSHGYTVGGWIVAVGTDELGRYVEVETDPVAYGGRVLPGEVLEVRRFYIAGIQGVGLYTATKQ